MVGGVGGGYDLSVLLMGNVLNSILKPRAEGHSIRNSREGPWEAITEPAIQMINLKEMVLEESRGQKHEPCWR